MSEKYPLCEKFGFPITGNGPMSPYIKARQVESFLERATVGYGSATENAGAFTYGIGLHKEAFDHRCLIIGVEANPDAENDRTLALKLAELLPTALNSAAGVQDMKDLAEKLVARILK